MESRLQRVLDAHGLPFAVAVDSSGAIVARAGDAAGFVGTGVYSGLLGPRGSPRATFDGLEGCILPAMYQQGGDFAFRDKPRPDLMVVVFGRGIRDVRELYRLSVEVGRSLAAEFQQAEPGAAPDPAT